MASNELRFKATMDDKVSTPLTQMESKFKSFGVSAGKAIGGNSDLGKGIGLAAGIAGFTLLGGAAVGAIDALSGTIGAASDMNETLSKSKVVFGDNADAAEKFGDTAARSMGLSKQQAVEAEATFGNLFKTIGLGEQPTLDMSQGMVKLASDLASFNNIDPTEALDKLRSGLAGESEPLRSVGVFLNEASVKAKAMALGLAGANGELSEAAKVTARYALIMDQTTTAQGDFGRTSDGLANTQRTLNAELDDASAKIGAGLLPAFTGLAHVVADDIVPALADWIDGLIGVGREADTAHPKMKSLVEATKDDLKTIGDAWQSFRREHLAGDALDVMKRGMEAQAAAAAAAAKAAERAWETSAEKIGSAGRGMGASLGEAAVAAGHFGTKSEAAFRGVGVAAATLDRKLSDLARDAISGYFDPIIEHDKLMADEARLAAAKRVLASKTASAAEKRDALATVHELERSTTESRIKLLEAGKLSKKEQGILLADLKKDWASATGDAKAKIGALIDKINAIPTNKQVNIHVNETHTMGVTTGGKGGGAKGFASGGRYEKDQPRIVGEHGPEWDIPDHSGTIVPGIGSGRPSGGGGMTFVYAPGYSTATLSEAQQFSRLILPELVRELRRQQLAF